MSAIDWLSDSVSSDPLAFPWNEPTTSDGAGTESISVTPLDEVSPDAVGLLPTSVTGLPRTLWGTSSSEDLARELEQIQTGLMPAMQDLLLTLLLAELDPPSDSDPSHALFLARVDALMELGAVEQAEALLRRAGPSDEETFSRWFDASLLTGTEDAACATLKIKPDLAPNLATRIFCLARNGDWHAAAVTLETGRALDQLTGAEDAILARFLDPETFSGAPELAPPTRPTPLVFRLYESVGEPIPSNILPLPFAQADLRLNTGWKSQIEAAERLARSGTLDENRLLGLYTERQPAASGGVWDRVAAVQAFETALAAGNHEEIASTLVHAWNVLGEADLQPVFADLYADKLADAALGGEAGHLAFEVGLLSPHYESIALEHQPQDASEKFLKAVARGDVTGISAPDETSAAIAEGFRMSTPPERLAGLVNDGNLGEAILRAIRMATDGAQGDLEKLRDAVALFRSIGLEDTARRFALQTMILVEDA
ncbi:hypothetical protein [Pseudoruegeria sp. HB172150]|uniref:hypothetical protein n=1 Tax=Pseudoruegeria sp. HB172150 TaxID=2721164 RepID=UPI001553B2FC|nr:hypothetical protein [Pseudoruegeria sp. HB172150]